MQDIFCFNLNSLLLIYIFTLFSSHRSDINVTSLIANLAKWEAVFANGIKITTHDKFNQLYF